MDIGAYMAECQTLHRDVSTPQLRCDVGDGEWLYRAQSDLSCIILHTNGRYIS